MIILDTNVISEITRTKPEPKVMRWIDSIESNLVYTTAITKSELLYGVECMPLGRRRTELEMQYDMLFATLLADKVIPFDEDCAQHFSVIAALAFRQGQNCSPSDLQIAAIANNVQFKIATRNIADFRYAGVELINPWTD